MAANLTTRQDAPADLAPVSESTAMLTLIERLAVNPDVDVAKLEKLMDLRERMLARAAKDQWIAAMSAAQAAMRPIAADADNPQTRSRYASYAALDRALRPIYTTHGFSLSFNTAETTSDTVRLTCSVMNAGHTEHYQIDMPADGKGAKGGDVMTKTHATGAAATYGMRYLLKMIFNVAVGEDDRDGNAPTERPAPPKGWDQWWTDFQSAADEGLAKLTAAWNGTPKPLRDYAATHYQDAMRALKSKARTVPA